MRIVIAQGGNALLRRGEPMTPEVQLGQTGMQEA
jgi:carbamate kinase